MPIFCRLRQLVHETETEAFMEANVLRIRPLVWFGKSFDPLKVWNRAFEGSLLTYVSFSHPSPLWVPCSVYFWESCERKGRQNQSEKQQKQSGSPKGPEFPLHGTGPRSDTFTWCETLNATLNLKSFYNNRICSHTLCLSLFFCECRHKQPELDRLYNCFFYF